MRLVVDNRAAGGLRGYENEDGSICKGKLLPEVPHSVTKISTLTCPRQY
jgi:hypothetical protein